MVDAMSTVKELVLSPDGTVFEPFDPDDVAVDDDDEQAAAARLTTAAKPTQPARPRRADLLLLPTRMISPR
jgi:hypothetical protein